MDRMKWFGRNTEAAILYAIVFLSPLLVGHPQDAVGIIVNGALVFAALRLPVKRAVPVIVIPVLGVLARALVFGPFPPFLPVTILLALAGNAILVSLIIAVKRKWLNLAAGIITKSAFMFLCTTALVSLSILPAAVLAVMGLFQFYTAAVGGAAVMLVLEFLGRKSGQKK
ncbi:MAG: hypothetical protein V1813_03070 [Candidatus Aenigmatarchaeota archaeon]